MSRWQTASAVLVWAALQAVLGLLGFDPHPLGLAAAVALVAALAWFVPAALDAAPADWRLASAAWSGRAGQDRRLAVLVRVVEGHLASRDPGPALHDSLRSLARGRLAARHGVPLDLPDADPRVAAALGPDLATLLATPPRRLRAEQVSRALDRIEEL